jgi:hypothetical protein
MKSGIKMKTLDLSLLLKTFTELTQDGNIEGLYSRVDGNIFYVYDEGEPVLKISFSSKDDALSASEEFEKYMETIEFLLDFNI